MCHLGTKRMCKRVSRHNATFVTLERSRDLGPSIEYNRNQLVTKNWSISWKSMSELSVLPNLRESLNYKLSNIAKIPYMYQCLCFVPPDHTNSVKYLIMSDFWKPLNFILFLINQLFPNLARLLISGALSGNECKSSQLIIFKNLFPVLYSFLKWPTF